VTTYLYRQPAIGYETRTLPTTFYSQKQIFLKFILILSFRQPVDLLQFDAFQEVSSPRQTPVCIYSIIPLVQHN